MKTPVSKMTMEELKKELEELLASDFRAIEVYTSSLLRMDQLRREIEAREDAGVSR